MRDECVRAVQIAAERMGKTVSSDTLRDIEAKIADARKQLAKQDLDGYRRLSREEQLARAGERVVADKLHNAKLQYRRKKLTVLKDREVRETLDQMKESGLSATEALRYYVFTVNDGRGGVMSIESRAKGIAHNYMARLVEFNKLTKESTVGGIQYSTRGMRDFIKESYGVDSGNPQAKKAWKEVESIRNEMIDEFNRLGGDVPKLANYRNPQALYAYKVARRGGKDGSKFVDDFMQWVDRSEYVNPDGSMMSDAQLREFLREAFITLKSDGANKIQGAGQSASVANRMKAHRQIHYKSPEAYIAAMDKYGVGGVFEQTVRNIENVAMDIALIDRLGPNAINKFDQLYADAVSESGGKTDPLARRAFASMSGQIGTSNPAVSHWVNEIKSAIVASRLGSMLLSQMADAGTAKMVTNSLNVSSMELMRWAKRMASDKELRSMARLHGLGIESVLGSVARFADGASTQGFFGKAATVIPTIQGAHLWTRILRQSFGTMLEAKLGDMTGKYADMGSLPAKDREIFSSLGVTKQHWSIWQMAKPTEYKGNRILGPDSIADVSPEAVMRKFGLETVREAEIAIRDASNALTTLTVEQSHQAVLQPGELSQATLKGSGNRGELQSEMSSLIFQFKSFPISIWRQAFVERARFGPDSNPLLFRAKLLAWTSALGGLSLMLNDMALGKDPRQVYDEDDPNVALQFGFKAMMKGGGLGFFGDLFDSVVSASADPWKSTGIMGPAAGQFLGSMSPAMYHGVSALVSGDEKEKERFSKYAYKSAVGLVPGQNLWFLKGFLHNVLLDDLQEMANPGYKKRLKARAREDYNQEYWLGRGEELRAPNISNIVGK